MNIHFKNLKEISKEHQLPQKGNLAGEVHVWCHTIHYDDPFLREAPFLLAESELTRAKRYHFEKDRRVYESGHVFIRKILSHYTGINAEKLELTPIVNQKPVLMNAPFKIHFNISHSGHKIIVAVGFVSDVGIDIEKVIPDFDTDGFAEANYHANEQKHLSELNGEDEVDYFYCIWTRKEAWLKLTGEGINDHLKELDFSGKDGKVHSLKPHGHHELFMTSWKDGSEYIATLASYAQLNETKFFQSDLLIQDFTPI